MKRVDQADLTARSTSSSHSESSVWCPTKVVSRVGAKCAHKGSKICFSDEIGLFSPPHAGQDICGGGRAASGGYVEVEGSRQIRLSRMRNKCQHHNCGVRRHQSAIMNKACRGCLHQHTACVLLAACFPPDGDCLTPIVVSHQCHHHARCRACGLSKYQSIHFEGGGLLFKVRT